MKSTILMAAVALFSTIAGQAQINNSKTETVKVYGNCNMCETTIEKAANQKKISKADWNENTKMASITYDSNQTNLDAVLKNIALAGYDSDKFLAPDAVYDKLPDCCRYDRVKKTAVALKDTAMAMSNQAGHDHTVGNNHNQAVTTTPRANQLQAIFDNYFAIKDALVKTDGIAASAKATTLLSALNAIKMDMLKTDEHTVWMKVEKDLKSDAQHITETKDAAEQRDHFAALSKNMYALIKAAKPSGKVYYQNCPMYKDGNGANWLSKESAIKNPYYGSMMVTCGKTVETIE